MKLPVVLRVCLFGFTGLSFLRDAALAVSFTNPTPITINSSATPPTPAAPYPSTITVSGLTANISKLTVTLNGFSHTFPDDVDIILVAPNGARIVLFSDVGSSLDVSNLSITLDDAAASQMPDSAVLSSATYRPTNVSSGDAFAAPAPAPVAADNAAPAGTATLASKFTGMTPAQANGTWSLFVVDDANGDAGSISNGWTITITPVPPTTAGQLVISEFRLRGFNGPSDEFIELYNTTNATLVTQSANGSSGLAVAASDGVARCVVPNGTSIPAHGHFLCTNQAASGYSLSAYPAGNGAGATGDATYTTGIADNVGIALFNNSTGGASFSLANRLDAVGPTNEANTVYKEGTGVPTLVILNLQSSYFRKFDPATGLPADTTNNSFDFFFADPNGTSAGAGQRLGAPGPQNLSSPIFGSGVTIGAVDAGCTGIGAGSSACGTSRDLTPGDPNFASEGTLSIRRKITNNTGVDITRLRFRITNLTTFPSGGNADLRVITSPTFQGNLSMGGTTEIKGLTLEQPPTSGFGAGFNGSVSEGTISLGSPLASGSSVNVSFLMGLEQTGAYQIAVQVEALPLGGAMLSVSGNSEDCTTQTCPANTTVSTDPNQCGAVVNYPLPALTGSCPASTCAPAPGSFFPKGTTTVTCASPTAESCQFSVTVVDSQPPSINCPADISQQAATGANSAIVNYPAPTVSDNCPGVMAAICTPASGSSFPIGSTQVSCTAPDAVNNTASCAFMVTVTPGPAPTPTPMPTATPTATPPTTLANISTRLRVETGDNVLIGGFIITGTQPKKVIVRGIGTSLALPDKLANPTLELHGPNGLVEANDNWIDSPNKQAIVDSTIPPSSDFESAIVQTLPANNAGYTAIVRGVNNSTGIGVVEAYDLDTTVDSRLANIATRGFVQSGDNVLIAGTIVVGQASQRVLIRAIGPSLPIAGVMANPTLELRDSNGALMQANDNWVDSPDKQAIIDTTIPPTNDLESAIIALLPANNSAYTAIVRGVNDTTGIAVVEIYALP